MQSNPEFTHLPHMYAVTIVILALGLSMYGLMMLASLNKQVSFNSQGQQIDRLMIGAFNIVAAMIAIWILAIIIQMNT